MADAKRVVFTFAASRERREAILLLDGVQSIATAGQHFVRIGLMANVPHQAVLRRVEDIMQSYRELHGAQAGGEVTAHLAHGVDQILAQLRGDLRQLAGRELTQIGG